MTDSPPADALGGLRRRAVWTLMAGVALAATGYIAAGTIGTIAGRNLGGSATWAGLPSAVAVLGTAAGAVVLSGLSVARGRRAALVAGFSGGVLGGGAAVLALVIGSLPLLLLGTAFVGLSNAAAVLSRYVGGDMFGPGERARRIGLVVWGSTAGAVVGPNLVGPSGSAAEAIRLPPEAGAYLVTSLACGAAAVTAFALLRPDPARLAAGARSRTDTARADAPMPPSAAVLHGSILTALVALVAGQVVMVMVMAMTPLHLVEHGAGLGVVGVVLSAHTLGMFALAPLSGRLTDRFGSRAVILAGFGVLAAGSLLSAAAPADGVAQLLVALFLLGWGWNLGFVAASSMLSSDAPLAARARLQGSVDAVVWTSSAASSVAAGPLLGSIGYSGLGVIAAALVVVPAIMVAVRRASFAVQRA